EPGGEGVAHLPGALEPETSEAPAARAPAVVVPDVLDESRAPRGAPGVPQPEDERSGLLVEHVRLAHAVFDEASAQAHLDLRFVPEPVELSLCRIDDPRR